MAKQKIHELAKELEVPSKIIVDYMNKKQKQPEKKYTQIGRASCRERVWLKV